jgi:hypothetical protein
MISFVAFRPFRGQKIVLPRRCLIDFATNGVPRFPKASMNVFIDCGRGQIRGRGHMDGVRSDSRGRGQWTGSDPILGFPMDGKDRMERHCSARSLFLPSQENNRRHHAYRPMARGAVRAQTLGLAPGDSAEPRHYREIETAPG